MIGSDSINLSLENIWATWFLFRRGKKRSKEIVAFEYFLEENLFRLHDELNRGLYTPGGYRFFEATDSKRRTIAVTPIRDRVVHRLLYEYLVPIFNPRFIHDAWSCRKRKGTFAALCRTQLFFRKNPTWFVWRTDITKFFDHVDRTILFDLLKRRISDTKALRLLSTVLEHSPTPKTRRTHERERERVNCRAGIPIGNLTSQIFANIYLHELDWHIKQTFGVKNYLRYGDDFVMMAQNIEKIRALRALIITFLPSYLRLEINPKHDKIIQAREGVRFLGVYVYARRRQLNRRNWRRSQQNLTLLNYSSYRGLVQVHETARRRREFAWRSHQSFNTAFDE